MNLLYISAFIVAIAFAFLVIYLIRTLKSANRTLDHLANTVAGLEVQMKGITRESEELLHRTNRLADDLQEKSQSLNTVFSSVKELGDSVGQITRSIRHMSTTVSTQAVKQSDQIAQAVQWGNVAIDLYAKFKDKKNQKVSKSEEELI
ncbi:DUF948 domain-containing protein [Bacillus suaedae]|uniref:DUF948 domain-containing protein n=1 Tax=Halalkalibacter suaedae TaxID=2822140 RepID=A0A941AME3_9BACI|nr:DUF948 domain-containing protein [Bacillus suaedae]MBP3949796.1 DUF948 domain-containing protein [Bacillus suaedae]